ncbi:hypothetical protein EVG20_g2267 [Dentipellis fragilis]|uniref:F-box domain-containing protein n=1 Tax=Dentipellis fragilis TaxID=205917 RepID=A0A4Y9Z7K6_9AGAM|nr:hypothetical protein EVG20_g2267 [Dentipellis fragilis]
MTGAGEYVSSNVSGAKLEHTNSVRRIRSLRRLFSPKQLRAVLNKKSPPLPPPPPPDFVSENPETPCISLISRLPNELLILVLELAKEAMETRISELRFNSTPAGITSHPWLALTLVCRHWRTLILTTQSFWRVVEFCSYQATRLRIERSGSASIEVGHSDNSLEPNIPDRDKILSLLFANVERARCLCFFGPCARRFLQEVAPYRITPALEVLRLQCSDTSDVLCDAFISDVSKLCIVDLGGIYALPTSRVFSSSVTSLSLSSHNLWNFERFTFPTMISILQRMPKLEELVLDNMLQGDSCVSEPVHLPRLETFRLNTHSFTQIGSFMQHLELPSSTSIFCRACCHRREDAVSSVSALVHPRSFSRFHISYTGTEIGLYGHFGTSCPDDDKEHTAVGSFSLHIQVQFLQPSHIPVIIFDLLSLLNISLTCVRKLTVVACDSWTSFDWAPLLTPFDAVEEISIRGSRAKWPLFVPALAKTVPVSSSEEDLRFLCPHLRLLGFVQCTCSWHTCATSQLNPTFLDRLADALEMRRTQSGRRMVKVTIGRKTRYHHEEEDMNEDEEFKYSPIEERPLYASKLHTIELSGVSVQSTSIVFSSNVTHLSLQSYDLPSVERFTIPSMLSALQKMPRLETLSLSSMLRWGDGDGDGSSGVHLPQLKTLRLYTHSLRQIYRFMQHLEVPSSTALYYYCRCDNVQDVASAVPILPHPRPFSGFHISFAGREFAMRGYYDTTTSDEPGEQLNPVPGPGPTPGTFDLCICADFLISAPRPMGMSSLPALFEGSLARVRKLTVETCEPPPAIDLAPLLAPFDTLDEVAIASSCATWHRFATALADTVPSAEQSRLGCPRLRKVSFVDCACRWHEGAVLELAFFGTLADALEMRSARGARMCEVVDSGEVVRVEELKAMNSKSGSGRRTAKWKGVLWHQ